MKATSTLAANVCSVSSTTMLMPATTALLWVWPVSLAASFSSSWTFTFPPWATSETEDALSCWTLSSLVHIQQLSRNMLGTKYNRRKKRETLAVTLSDPCCPASRSCLLPLVCWFLFSGQSMAGYLPWRAPFGPGFWCRPSHHRFLLLLHPYLGLYVNTCVETCVCVHACVSIIDICVYSRAISVCWQWTDLKTSPSWRTSRGSSPRALHPLCSFTTTTHAHTHWKAFICEWWLGCRGLKCYDHILSFRYTDQKIVTDIISCLLSR